MSGKPRGVTLIEFMIVVAIVGILSGPLFIRLPSLLRQVQLMNQAQGELARSAQTSLHLLADDIRDAASVEDQWQEHKSSERCLILKVPAAVRRGGASEPAFDRIVYAADNRDPRLLVKRVYPAPGSLRRPTRQVLSKGLSGLRFALSQSPRGVRLVSFELSLAAGYYRRVLRETFGGVAGLRNGGSP
ncbi:MAG: prepilin-type N-terminal cleavage/methylation domain-containing protein [Elusimicrobia bacterium]|nr:prepilin-type N-terminal cleavage/methylation domain-containing protein [Elusimicrobiota bacterium]